MNYEEEITKRTYFDLQVSIDDHFQKRDKQMKLYDAIDKCIKEQLGIYYLKNENIEEVLHGVMEDRAHRYKEWVKLCKANDLKDLQEQAA